MEERDVLRYVILFVVAALAVVALAAPSAKKWASTETTTTASSESSKTPPAFAAMLPRDFELDGALSGQDEEPGLDFPGATPIRVSGTSAEAKGERATERLLGADRLSGVESYSFKGSFDRKYAKLRGNVVWTLRGKVGQRYFEWRFEGVLDAAFTDSTNVKGKLTGVTTKSDRYGSPDAAPQTASGSDSWKYGAIRGR